MTGLPVWAVLIGSALLVALSAQAFANGVEWTGFRLRLGYRAAGGLLAAWGTALPETVIPLFALASGSGAAQAVGVGAILGAPFLLATLAFAFLGAAVSMRARRGGKAFLAVAPDAASNDLGGFVVLFAIALAAGILSWPWVKWLAGALLATGYAVYVSLALHSGRSSGPLPRPERFLWTRSDRSPSLSSILALTAAGLFGLLLGAHGFVIGLTELGHAVRISHLVLAVVLAPVATELPEVGMSLVWVSKERDDLALAAITGAMIFQATIGPLLGLFLTPWNLGGPERFAASLALGAAVFFSVGLRLFRQLEIGPLLFGAAFYGLFVIGIIAS